MAISTGGRRPRGPGCLQPLSPVRVRPRGLEGAPGAACLSSEVDAVPGNAGQGGGPVLGYDGDHRGVDPAPPTEPM
jgi:hypothetical protein